jgi:hypothetical protein
MVCGLQLNTRKHWRKTTRLALVILKRNEILTIGVLDERIRIGVRI